jgi:hypothetical protein
MEFRNWLEGEMDRYFAEDLPVVVRIKGKYPGVKVYAYETAHKIELMQLEVPEGMRGEGIGTDIIKMMQDYAASAGKPIVIRPEAERGRKADLDRFYKRLGFVHNRGRNTDFAISSPLASTMYWRPLRESAGNDMEGLDRFYRDNEQKVLSNPEIQEQLKSRFQADGKLIRKILGVGSEDGRGNYFVRVFNQRHGDWGRSIRVPFKKTGPEKTGRPGLPKDALSWFRGSKVTDEEGNPKVVYHGTNERFERFEAGEFGFHFGDENAAGMMGDTQKFLLRITNPLRLKDLGTWEPERVLKEIRMKFKIPDDVADKTLGAVRKLGDSADLNQDDDMVLNRKAHYRWSGPVRDLIKSLGHDGIVYRNEAEGFSDSYIAFNPEQAKRLG